MVLQNMTSCVCGVRFKQLLCKQLVAQRLGTCANLFRRHLINLLSKEILKIDHELAEIEVESQLVSLTPIGLVQFDC